MHPREPRLKPFPGASTLPPDSAASHPRRLFSPVAHPRLLPSIDLLFFLFVFPEPPAAGGPPLHNPFFFFSHLFLHFADSAGDRGILKQRSPSRSSRRECAFPLFLRALGLMKVADGAARLFGGPLCHSAPLRRQTEIVGESSALPELAPFFILLRLKALSF